MQFIIYQQSSGKFWTDGKPAASGYSGNHEGKNRHALQHDDRIGPIPLGVYRINFGKPEEREGTDYSFDLIPEKGTEAEGRTGLRISGDVSATRPAGSVYAPRRFRYDLSVNSDKFLYLIVIQ